MYLGSITLICHLSKHCEAGRGGWRRGTLGDIFFYRTHLPVSLLDSYLWPTLTGQKSRCLRNPRQLAKHPGLPIPSLREWGRVVEGCALEDSLLVLVVFPPKHPGLALSSLREWGGLVIEGYALEGYAVEGLVVEGYAVEGLVVEG